MSMYWLTSKLFETTPMRMTTKGPIDKVRDIVRAYESSMLDDDQGWDYKFHHIETSSFFGFIWFVQVWDYRGVFVALCTAWRIGNKVHLAVTHSTKFGARRAIWAMRMNINKEEN